MSCQVVKGLNTLRAQTAGVKWLIASGGDQAELRAVFEARHLSHYFDGGIWGSPRSKIDILTNTAIEKPALFIGDSKYDHWVSTQLGLEFLFVTDWTDVIDVEQWLSNEKSINHCRSVADLLLPT